MEDGVVATVRPWLPTMWWMVALAGLVLLSNVDAAELDLPPVPSVGPGPTDSLPTSGLTLPSLSGLVKSSSSSTSSASSIDPSKCWGCVVPEGLLPGPTSPQGSSPESGPEPALSGPEGVARPGIAFLALVLGSVVLLGAVGVLAWHRLR